MKEDLVKTLMTQFDSSSITELKWQEENFSFQLSKLDAPIATNNNVNVEESRSLLEEGKEEDITFKEPKTSKDDEPLVEENLKSIESPLVGVVYLQETPDSPTFKSVGDRVEIGDTVCIIEAMKVMNEIQSEIAGTISEICVSNEEVVAYNQPIFKIKED